jgi:hypothetical protein
MPEPRVTHYFDSKMQETKRFNPNPAREAGTDDFTAYGLLRSDAEYLMVKWNRANGEDRYALVEGLRRGAQPTCLGAATAKLIVEAERYRIEQRLLLIHTKEPYVAGSKWMPVSRVLAAVYDQETPTLPPPPPTTKPEWEYKLVRPMTHETCGVCEIEDVLNRYGTDGWELCGIDYGCYIFKRPV